MKLRPVLYCLLAHLVALPAAGHAQTAYYAVLMDGKKVGHGTHSRIVAAGKVTTTDVMKMTLSRAGMPLTIRQEEIHVETVDGKPLSFKSVQDMAIMAMEIAGTVDKTGKLHIKISSGQNKQERTMDWPEGALMSEGLLRLQKEKGRAEGTSYTVKMFAGALLGSLTGQVQVGPTQDVDLLGRVVKLTEVKTIIQAPTGQMTTTSYVDKHYKALKTVLPVVGMKVEVIACSKQAALSKPEAFEAFDKLTLASPAPLKDVRSAKSITYHLAPIGGKKISLPATDSQTVRPGENGTLIVTFRPIAAPAGSKFPYKGGDEAAMEALKPTRFLQSDNRKVIALSRKAVGDATDAAQAVKRIETFVRKYVSKKSLSVGYATAAEVVESKQGDCSEHAVLLAAMCRAVGIPAQVVMGMAYVEEFGGLRHVFGGHAWARAFVGGKWVDLDGAMNGFEPGHITLAVGNGNPESFFQMLTSLGYFRIAKVEVRK